MGIYIGPDGVRGGEIRLIRRDPTIDLDYEVIERKGIGHPDTIADTLASRISRNYSRYTINHCDGLILHHQVDKLMVIGGKEDISWGGGRFIEPVKIVVAGRASRSYQGKSIPVDDIIEKTIKQYFREFFPLFDVDSDLIIQNEMSSSPGPGTIRESKGAIANMFNPMSKNHVRGYEKLIANDTSFCVGYAPYSGLEKAILETEKYLNSPEIKIRHPWLGTDIKMMGIRFKEKIDITTCIPQIAKHVHSIEEYRDNLNTTANMILEILDKYFSMNNIDLSVNTKDDYEKNNVYLTLTGSSLSGDIGVVGRGNRINGLITSRRPMSLEGANGKNPRYYSGFVYSFLSQKIADRIYKTINKPCDVEIVSQNGGYLLYPWITTVIAPFNDEKMIRELIEYEFTKIPDITHNFINGDLTTW